MNIWGRLSEFWVECKRVLRITKKPTKAEYFTIVKVSGLGIAAIGFIGFVLHMIYQFII